MTRRRRAGSAPPNALEPLDGIADSVHRALMELAAEQAGKLAPAEFDAFTDQLLDAVGELLPQTLQDSAGDLAQRLDQTRPAFLKQHHAERDGFRSRLREHWGDAFGRLEALLQACVEFGDDFNREGQRPDVEPPGNLHRVLAQLHARSCRVGLEILTLLEAGLADGAHARWRTLYEIAVVSLVIQERGEEAATRYLEHAVFMRRKAARHFQASAPLLGWEQIPAEEIAEIESRANALLAKYGKSFQKDYGWAGPIDGNNEPSLEQLEKSVSLSRWRAYANWANSPVHASAHGLQALGLSPHWGRSPYLLTGASNAGLGDPGQNTALTLVLVCVALAGVRPTLDRTVALQAINLMSRDTQDAFMAAHWAMEKRWKARKRSSRRKRS